MAGPLFIGGTASHAGKSWFTAAFCRLLHRRGVRVAPFKAQNMSNNSYPCIEGGEIGRAQAMQAEACELPPMADMNPVLLKPQSDTGSQVVLRGSVWRSEEAGDYYRHSDRLMQIALESYTRLASQFDFIVCEGAGSVAEVNLASRDFTNLRFAQAVSAKALLVADIDRGGVFGALVGTMELLPPEQRARIGAFAINRFRGDPELFHEGVAFLEKRLQLPCLGVFPYAPEIQLDEEDGVSIPASGHDPDADVAVIHLPHISNFTDFRLFPKVSWIDRPVASRYRVVFVPGTKSTMGDLQWMRERGLCEWLREQHAHGATIVGICGGYQILGLSIADPDGVESNLASASNSASMEGLGLLPVRTVLRAPKVTRVVTASLPDGGEFQAYEIHMGQTDAPRSVAPFAYLAGDVPEGARSAGVMGTYLHGIFEHSDVVRQTLGMAVPCVPPKSEMYDRLADWLVAHSNPQVLENLLG